MSGTADGHPLTLNPISKGQILLVATSHSELGEGKATGADATEIAVPFVTWKSNGFDVTIASPKGGEVPLDPTGLEKAKSSEAPPECSRFLKNDAAMQMLKNSVKLDQVQQLEGLYSAIFLSGGHGAIMDLPEDKKLQSLLCDANAKGIVIAAICHGPAALVNVEGKDGWMVKGRRIVCYSNEEERLMGTDKLVPWLMEDKLKERGAEVVVGPPGAECAEADGNLITAQNPSSVFKLATITLEKLTENFPEKTSTPNTVQEIGPGEKKSGTGSVAQAMGTNPPQQSSEDVSRLR